MFGWRYLTILRDILDRAVKVTPNAEVFQIVTKETPVIFEANKLKMLETRESSGIALRLIKNGRLGFAVTTNLQDIDQFIGDALELASIGAASCIDLPSYTNFNHVPVYDPAIEKVSMNDMVQVGQVLLDSIRTMNSNLLIDGRVTKIVSTVSLLNSKGSEVTYTKGVFAIGMEAMLVRGEDMLFVGEHEVSCHPVLDTTKIRASIETQLELSKEIVEPVMGSLPVIFTPHGVSGALLQPLITGFNGRNIIQGSSPLVGKMGQKIVSNAVSVWDDPTIPYAPGSSSTDDEGVPSQRKALIKNGVVETFLYDLQTACQAGVKSTGNGSRSLGSLPSPSASLLLIDEGTTSYEDMINDIKDGIIVERLLGAGQGNVLSGDFNANVLLGYRIRNGKPCGRVKNTMISGNVYEALNNLGAIGNQSRWVGGSFKTPPLYFHNISVSSRS